MKMKLAVILLIPMVTICAVNAFSQQVYDPQAGQYYEVDSSDNMRGEEPVVGGDSGTYYNPTHDGQGGMINSETGEYLNGSGDGGLIGSRDGTYYSPDGNGGYINTRTGEHMGN